MIKKCLILIIFLYSNTCILMASEDSTPLPILHVFALFENGYKDTGETITGPHIKKVHDYLKNSGLEYKIEVSSYARAKRQLLERSDTIIIGLTRTLNREHQFHWLYLLTDIDLRLITRNSTEMNKLSKTEIIEGDYTAICALESRACDLLTEYGFPEDRIFKIPARSSVELMSLVLRGRSDFFISNYRPLKIEMEAAGFNYDDALSKFQFPNLSGYVVAPKHFNPLFLEILEPSSNK